MKVHAAHSLAKKSLEEKVEDQISDPSDDLRVI